MQIQLILICDESQRYYNSFVTKLIFENCCFPQQLPQKMPSASPAKWSTARLEKGIKFCQHGLLLNLQ